ncbi:serine/threonine-protein kinase [Xanthobacter oligotrophicus]|uniref:serine/threonine-protein kinase n=1 Tax=Xanthobacter oligotrophicus TaxID=2607286 RepID=UPI0011F3771A|nr:serine/threonine-protein kinase [Xanthobacter oligotrophicus]MCG5233972.1 serine/threonine protein kinase [Xanthobacter oligotrophicus]
MNSQRPSDPGGTWLPPGTRLNDLFEIDEGIAAGGMGEIYRGHAIETGDPVAIKTIRSDVAETETALAMFRKEARALHNLNHEAIVRYYVFSVDPTLKRPYLAMEYVSGPSLSAMVRNGALGQQAVRVLGARVASGLQAAHERGIIHRDISPDNVIIPDGDVAQAKIIDFGIARQTRAAEATIVGDGFAGKYNYVSPEQLGLNGGDVSAASDIYSLGLVLAEAVTGRPIDMRGTPVEIIEKRRRVPDLSHVDGHLRPLLEWMLQPEPRERPGSMTEVAAWLRRGSAATPSSRGTMPPEDMTVVSVRPGARPPSAAQSAMPRRWTIIGATGGAAALLALLGGGAYWLMSGPAGAPAPTVRQDAPRQDAPYQDAARHPPAPAPGRGGAPAVIQILPDAPAPPSPADMVGFLDRYALAECTFLEPVVTAESRAVGDGFGRTQGDFRSVAADFKRVHGLGLDVRLQEVTPPQCPVVDLVARARGEKAFAPQLELVSYTVRQGGVIDGEASAPRGRLLSVVLVFADGTVQVVAASIRAEGAGLPFHLALDPRAAPPGSSVLVVALSSAQAIPGLRTDASLPAETFVAQARRAEDRLGAAARHVVVR